MNFWAAIWGFGGVAVAIIVAAILSLPFRGIGAALMMVSGYQPDRLAEAPPYIENWPTWSADERLQLTLIPDSVRQGGKLDIFGSGFKEQANVVIEVAGGGSDEQDLHLGTFTANELGGFADSIYVPNNLMPGTWAVWASVDGQGLARMNLTVIQPRQKKQLKRSRQTISKKKLQ